MRITCTPAAASPVRNIVFDQHRFAFHDIDKLVLGLAPMLMR